MAFGQTRLSAEEKIGLVSNLSTMLKAGIPIADTIAALLEEANGHQRKILLTLQEYITAGKQISEALDTFPLVFNKVTVSLIKAAEEAGTLEATLKDLETSIQDEMEFEDKVKSAMFYPMVVMVIFFGVMMSMLLIVIPRTSTVFSRLQVPLPLPTKFLIFTSYLMINNWLIVR